MSIHDHSTLAALIKAYEKSIVFEESTPHALSVAKIFTQMRWSKGGLVLLGVRRDGTVTGLAPSELPAVYTRFERLCRDLTATSIKLGTLIIEDRVVVFMVFNATHRLLAPLRHYSSCISNTRLV